MTTGERGARRLLVKIWSGNDATEASNGVTQQRARYSRVPQISKVIGEVFAKSFNQVFYERDGSQPH